VAVVRPYLANLVVHHPATLIPTQKKKVVEQIKNAIIESPQQIQQNYRDL